MRSEAEVPGGPGKELTADLDVLTRPGESERVVSKKVLLAHLARAEAARLGIVPDAARVQAVADALRAELGLRDADATRAWLAEAGLTVEAFTTVLEDLAAVQAVEAHHRERLAARIELHRRLLTARAHRLAQAAAR